MEFTRCYGCMRELSAPGAVCPHCGYDNTNGPASQPSHVLPCGTVLNGKYITGRSLGQGGFGITYIGFDLSLEQPVCLKEYFPSGAAMRSSTESKIVLWSASEDAQRMKQSREGFVKEARRAARLRGLSHVVNVWEVFYENETAYIAMEYIEGETLKDRLVRTQTPLDERECIDLLTPIIEDLEKAHARGIVHRDIKPDNIMLKPDGEPMLLDMGAAKDLGKAAQNGGTLSSTMVVSQGFSPVEQYSERGEIGPWTDVYAMSATIIYCVSGKVPPPAIDRSMYGDEVDFNAVSPSVAAVLEKGLAIKPENRYRTMGELLNALRAAVADEQTKQKPKPKLEPRPIQKPGPKPEPERKPKPEPGPEPKIEGPKIEKKPPSARKRLPLPIGAVAVLAILAVGIFVGGKGKLPAIADMTAKASAIFRAEETPIPTPSGEPLSTGEFGVLSYEEFKNCIRISDCETSVTNVEIPEKIEGKPVTSIGNNAFSGCSSLTSITIPNSVISIGEKAFYSCIALMNVAIPNRVTSIGDYAFYNCSSLKSITVPEGVTSIGNYAFSYCCELTSIIVPDSVTGIGNYTFYDCNSLTSITIPNSVTSIGNYVFYYCSSLASITIPDSVTSIGNSAFLYCSSLTSITIPDNVSSIGDAAFNRCSSLTSITIPDSVTSIGNYAFGIVDELSDVYYSGTEEQWKAIQIGAYNAKLTNATIHYNSVFQNGSDSSVEDLRVMFNNTEIQTDLTIWLNDDIDLTVQVMPNTLQDLKVEWESGNEEIMKLDNSGINTVHVKCIDNGNLPSSTTLTLSCEGFEKQFTVYCRPER